MLTLDQLLARFRGRVITARAWPDLGSRRALSSLAAQSDRLARHAGKVAGSVPKVLSETDRKTSFMLHCIDQRPLKVTGIAEPLEVGTRTLLTEIDIPSPDSGLQPGSYLDRRAPLSA
jgi:hypothetical protein